MPPAAQYANASGPNKTMINDLLDLDEESQSQGQLTKKFIRNSMPARSFGVEGGEYQDVGPMGSSMRGGHQQMTPQQMHHARIPQQMRVQPVHEDFEDISIQSVANRVFPSTARYVQALDDSDDPLHKVAISLLGSGVPGCDKTVYIVIIIILCIAIACMLWRCGNR